MGVTPRALSICRKRRYAALCWGLLSLSPVAAVAKNPPAQSAPKQASPTRASQTQRVANRDAARGELYRRARNHESNREVLRALSVYHQIATLFPGATAAYMAMGRLREELGDTKQAIAMYQQASRQRTAPPLASLRLAYLSRGTADGNEATRRLKEAAERTQDPKIWVRLAAWYEGYQAYSAALNIWRRLRRTHPGLVPPEKLRRLSQLSAGIDPVMAPGSRDWVRRSLSKLGRL